MGGAAKLEPAIECDTVPRNQKWPFNFKQKNENDLYYVVF
jgi:hypothetical protein